MTFRRIINSILAVGTISLSTFVFASPSLFITNNTDFPSTTIANNGTCSSNLPPRGYGVTPPHTQNKEFDGKIIRAACIANMENCKAAVYLSDNCLDPVIANVTFSVNTGIKGRPENMANSGYCIKGTGFVVTLDPNPTNQPCD